MQNQVEQSAHVYIRNVYSNDYEDKTEEIDSFSESGDKVYIRYKSQKKKEPYCYNKDNVIIIKKESLYGYLQEVARIRKIRDEKQEEGNNEVGGNSKESDKGISVARYYRMLETYLDLTSTTSAGYFYFNPEEYKGKGGIGDDGKTLIYPFGCNNSQKKSVEAAFRNRISLIQGPPGTGKTQTILNIVANIICRGKTVLVVSSNNSAVDNVIEKMNANDVGFLCAKLGSKANINKFLENQPELPYELKSWECHDSSSLARSVNECLIAARKIYELREEYAKVRLDAYTTELEFSRWKNDRQEEGWLNESSGSCRVKFSSKDIIKILPWIYETDTYNYDLKIFVKRALDSIAVKAKLSAMKGACQLLFGMSDVETARAKETLTHKLEEVFYTVRIEELNKRKTELAESLCKSDNARIENMLKDSSTGLFKHCIFERLKDKKERKSYTEDEIKNNLKDFLSDYPVVLSTTFSSRKHVAGDVRFDYVIMDEASQVPIEQGVLALSCAKNAIIVGDLCQLPAVIDSKNKRELKEAKPDGIADCYDCSQYSFMASILMAIPNLPCTMLREHYRCHPKIINFCNQKFYGGELLIMTEDHQEKDVITVIQTESQMKDSDIAEFKEKKQEYNETEVGAVVNELAPIMHSKNKPAKVEGNQMKSVVEGNMCPKEVGVVTPFNVQVEHIKKAVKGTCKEQNQRAHDLLCDDGILVSTVHKFQGRERDVMLMSVCKVTPFSNDPQSLNVAVSRAKKKFRLFVTSESVDGNIGDLVKYISENGGSIGYRDNRSIYSVLYGSASEKQKKFLERLKTKYQSLAEQKKKSKQELYVSEYLTLDVIEGILHNDPDKNSNGNKFGGLDYSIQTPLKSIVETGPLIGHKELEKFAFHSKSHIDFLIFNRTTHEPLLAIEVDGYKNHKNEKQKICDEKKNKIMRLCNLELLRLNTRRKFSNDMTNEKKRIIETLDKVLMKYNPLADAYVSKF